MAPTILKFGFSNLKEHLKFGLDGGLYKQTMKQRRSALRKRNHSEVRRLDRIADDFVTSAILNFGRNATPKKQW